MYELRAIKDREEIRLLAKAARLADYGVEIGIDALREGCTEIEIVAEIEYELKRKGVQGMSFSTTVLFGEKTALPHGTPETASSLPATWSYSTSVSSWTGIVPTSPEPSHTGESTIHTGKSTKRF